MKTFLALERRVWEALKRGDAAGDRELLSRDFLGVYASGFSSRERHAAQLKSGPIVASYRLRNARLTELGPDRALLVYEALWRHASGARRRTFISSIWERRGGRWLNTFSQDTEAA